MREEDVNESVKRPEAGDRDSARRLDRLLDWARSEPLLFCYLLASGAAAAMLGFFVACRFVGSETVGFRREVLGPATGVSAAFLALDLVLAFTVYLQRRGAESSHQPGFAALVPIFATGIVEIGYYLYLFGFYSSAILVVVGIVSIARVMFSRRLAYSALALSCLILLGATALYHTGAVAYAPIFPGDVGRAYRDPVILWTSLFLVAMFLWIAFVLLDLISGRMQAAVVRLENTNRELVLAQADLAGAQPLASLGGLVSRAAKELNAPLSIALSVSESMLTDLGERYSQGLDSKKVSELYSELSTTLEAQQRAKRIIEALFELAKYSEQQSYEPVDINVAVTEALRAPAGPVAEAQELVEQRLEPDLPFARGQLALIRDAFSHVVSNALWAFSDRATHGAEKPPHVELRTYREDDEVVWVCRDTGAGMNAEQLAHCREPFFTTRRGQGGIGLGLYVADRVVRWAGGTLGIDSAPGKGTAVTIRLPLWHG